MEKLKGFRDAWSGLSSRDRIIALIALILIAVVFWAIGRSVVARRMVIVEKPVAQTVVVEKPIIVEKPVAQTVVVEKAVVVEKPIAQTVIVEKPVAETVIVEKPVAETVIVEKPITTTVIVEKLITATVIVEKLITVPAVVETPTPEAAVVETPTPEAAVVETPTPEAAVVETPTEVVTPEVAVTPTPRPAEEVPAVVEPFAIRLPRMYVVYDDTGDPSVFGLKASTIESWLAPWVGPNSLWMLKIHPYYTDWIKAANIQHIEAVWDSKGIFVFVNGKPMPYLAWDGESLDYMGQMAEAFGVPYAGLIRRLLPLLQHIGLDIVVQMPLAEGAAPIPYRDVAAGLMEVTEAAERIKEPSAMVGTKVVYNERGAPTIAGISIERLETVTGYSLWMTKLDPNVIASLQAANIQHVVLMTRSNGLYVFVNGHALPSLIWSEEHLDNAVDLYVQSNAPSPVVETVKRSVPQLSQVDVWLVIRFPLAEGAEPIPLP